MVSESWIQQRCIQWPIYQSFQYNQSTQELVLELYSTSTQYTGYLAFHAAALQTQNHISLLFHFPSWECSLALSLYARYLMHGQMPFLGESASCIPWCPWWVSLFLSSSFLIWFLQGSCCSIQTLGFRLSYRLGLSNSRCPAFWPHSCTFWVCLVLQIPC